MQKRQFKIWIQECFKFGGKSKFLIFWILFLTFQNIKYAYFPAKSVVISNLNCRIRNFQRIKKHILLLKFYPKDKFAVKKKVGAPNVWGGIQEADCLATKHNARGGSIRLSGTECNKEKKNGNVAVAGGRPSAAPDTLHAIRRRASPQIEAALRQTGPLNHHIYLLRSIARPPLHHTPHSRTSRGKILASKIK